MFRRSGHRLAVKNMRHSTSSRACPDSEGTGRALDVLAAVAVETEVAVVDIVGVLIGLHVVWAVVEEAVAPAATCARGSGSASDVVEPGLARELAAGGAAIPGRRAGCASCRIEGRLRSAPVAHHPANAVEQQRAADHAGRGGGRGAEKRAAA